MRIVLVFSTLIIQLTLWSQECLNLFDQLDREWIVENCYNQTTSTIENATDFGFEDGKVGHYTLFFEKAKHLPVEYIGILRVRYFNKPWRRFSNDEIWFQIKIESSKLIITEDLFVGQRLKNVVNQYGFIEAEEGWKYESDCERLYLMAEEGVITSLELTKKF